jgi:RND family efflux transporter MFP subunit
MFLAAATVCLVALTSCSKHSPPAGPQVKLPTVTVTTTPVGQTRHEATEEVVGTVRAQLRTVVEAKVSGRIEQLPVVAGQRVARGDLLVQLDAREIRARLDQAVAMRDQADGDLQRFSSLLKQEAVTRAEFDGVQARQRVAQATVTEAETLLAYTLIVAPFDGIITRKLADLGDLAAPGKPLLELEDPNRLRLEINVPEALLDRVRQGASLPVRIASLEKALQGTVTEIAPSSDPGSRTFLAKIDLPDHPGLRAGQFGRAAIAVGHFAALRVPASAVVHRGQMELLFVVQNNQARLRLVRTGKHLGNEVEIVSGIEINEIVVTDKAASLLDGQPVQTQP